MADVIEGGVWAGAVIRTARKPFQCDYWRGESRGGRCPATIEAGVRYFEGDGNPGKAGGFACDRYCLTHAEDR